MLRKTEVTPYRRGGQKTKGAPGEGEGEEKKSYLGSL
jgi:hypothetical protein